MPIQFNSNPTHKTFIDNQEQIKLASREYEKYVNNEPPSLYQLKPRLPPKDRISMENLQQQYSLNPNPAADRALDRRQMSGSGIGAHYNASQRLITNAGGSSDAASWQKEAIHKKWGLALREKYYGEIDALLTGLIHQLDAGTFDATTIDGDTRQRLRKYITALIPQNAFSPQIYNANHFSRQEVLGLDATAPGSRYIQGIGLHLNRAIFRTDTIASKLMGFILNCSRVTPTEQQLEYMLRNIKSTIQIYQISRSNEIDILETYHNFKKEAIQERRDKVLAPAEDELYEDVSAALLRKLASIEAEMRRPFVRPVNTTAGQAGANTAPGNTGNQS